VDDHGIVGINAEDADLEQIAGMGRADTHREVVIESPLGDGVAGGMKHVLVSDAVLPSCLRDAFSSALTTCRSPRLGRGNGSTLRVVADEDRLPERDHARQRTD